MRKLANARTVAVLSLVALAGAVVLVSGCRLAAPTAKAVVETIQCPDCGGTVVLMSDKGAEDKDHMCLYCKEVWDRLDAYSGTGWVTVCEKCDKVLGACPKCQEKMKAATAAAS